MKATFNREKITPAYLMAASVAPSRTTKPILEQVKLELRPEGSTLMATDLEVGLRVELEGVDVESPGSVVLPKQFAQILRESSDDTLSIDSDGTVTRVRGQRSQFQLPTHNPDEYPVVAPFQESAYHRLPGRFFRELIRRTAFATDPESSRYALGGVLLELTEKEIIGVGTDGRRLARQSGPAESVGGHKTTENTVVPTKALQLMEKAVADKDDQVELAAHDNAVLMKSGRTTVYARLVEGRYPRWRDVFPRQAGAATIELCVGPFHSAVRQAAIVTDNDHRGLDFTFGEGRLVITSRGTQLGESRVEMPVAFDGTPIPVKLDPRFIIDFLRVLDADKAFSFWIRDAESAVVCNTDDGYSYVVMPLARDS